MSGYELDKNINLTESILINENSEYFDDMDTEENTIRCSNKSLNTINSNKVKWYKRYFSPIRQGSFRGSIISLASQTFDTTCLSFPLALQAGGLIPGTLIFIFIIIASYSTLKLLIYCGEKNKTIDSRELVGNLLGKKWITIYDLSAIVFCFGCQVAYLVTINSLFIETADYFFEFNPHDKIIKLIQMISCMIIFQIPLCLIKNLSSLQYASMVGSGVLIYTMIIMFIESFYYYDKGINEGRHIKMYDFNWKLLDTFSLFMYGYSNHNALFSIYSEMDRPNLRRQKRVLNRATILQTIIFITVAYSGFFSLIEKMPTIFLSRPRLENFDPDDYLVLIAKLLFIISLYCICATNFNLLRTSLLSFFFKGKELSNCKNFILVLIVLILCNTISYFSKNVVDVIGIISGLCVTMICYIIPILCYIKTNTHNLTYYKNIISIIFLIIFTVLGILCSGYCFIQNIWGGEEIDNI